MLLKWNEQRCDAHELSTKAARIPRAPNSIIILLLMKGKNRLMRYRMENIRLYWERKKTRIDTKKVLAFISRTHNHFDNEFFANIAIKAKQNPSNDNMNRCCWLLTTPIVPLTKPNHNKCVCMCYSGVENPSIRQYGDGSMCACECDWIHISLVSYAKYVCNVRLLCMWNRPLMYPPARAFIYAIDIDV